MDRQHSLDLVFNDRINVARGEATAYVDGGIIVRDADKQEEKIINADGIVLATGYENVDLPQRWAGEGFLKSKFVSSLENPNTLEIDQEGEYVGIFTDSGRECISNPVSEYLGVKLAFLGTRSASICCCNVHGLLSLGCK